MAVAQEAAKVAEQEIVPMEDDKTGVIIGLQGAVGAARLGRWGVAPCVRIVWVVPNASKVC